MFSGLQFMHDWDALIRSLTLQTFVVAVFFVLVTLM